MNIPRQYQLNHQLYEIHHRKIFKKLHPTIFDKPINNNHISMQIYRQVRSQVRNLIETQLTENIKK